MRKIKDFFYNFSDIIFALLIVAGITFLLYDSINNISNIEANANPTQISETNSQNEPTEINVTIPKSVGVEQLSEILYEYKVIENKENFITMFANKVGKIKSGEYILFKNMDLNELGKIIFTE